MNRRHSIRSLSGAREQRGAIIVMAALALSLVVILLSVADIGFLYYYKREYQKAADLAAMAGAKRLVSETTGIRSCDGNALPAAQANAAQNLGSKNYALTVLCGKWNPSGTTPETRFDTGVDADQLDAVRAVISGTPPRFLPYVTVVTLTARATALADQPLAQLRIRSTLATVDTAKSPLLNSVVGGLLGGSINLPVAAWNGLLNTDINLLKYLDALALELGLDVGNYDQVLGADVTVGQLLDVAADVLNRGGGTGDVNAAVGGLGQLLGVNLPGFEPLVKLGDILQIQTGTPSSALDLGLNVFELVQGSVQLASSECAVCVTLPINVPGLVGVNVQAKVMEPPRISAIGNPALAALDPLGADRIYVRTAQVRSLISVDLPIAGALLTQIQNLLNSSVISGITNAVNDLLSLNLLGLLQSLSCVVYCDIQRDVIDIRVLPSPRLDINLDAGAGQAYVDDYRCGTQEKSLDVPTDAAAAYLRIGKMGTSAQDAANKVFASSAPPVVDPVAILDIGTKHVRYQCTLLLFCWTEWKTASGSWDGDPARAARTAFSGGGIGLKAELPVAGNSSNQIYLQPPVDGLPDVGEAPAWKTVTSANVVGSLRNTLGGLQLQFYQPSGSGLGGNGLGNVLFLVGSVVNSLVATVMNVVTPLLSGLLDPLLNLLLDTLGVDLNKVEIGANLSCDGGGATLID